MQEGESKRKTLRRPWRRKGKFWQNINEKRSKLESPLKSLIKGHHHNFGGKIDFGGE